MKRIAIFLLLLVPSLLAAQTTRTAATGNPTDVQATINLSSPGDTVIIPNGNWTWTSGVTMGGISLQGQSVGGVVITDNNPTGCASGCVPGSFLIYVTTSAAAHAGVANLNFLPGTATGGVIHVVDGAGCGAASQPANCVILAHDITANVPNFQFFNIIDHHATGGVYWNIHLASTNNLGGACGGAIIGSQSGAMVVEEPGLSWDNATTYGTLDSNGTQNVYIEDSDFTYIYQMPDVDSNGRVVLRHDVWTNAQGLTHGTTSVTGGRFIEAYSNSFINNNVNADISRWFWLRAGSMIYANNAIQAAGNSCHPGRSSLQMVVENAQGVGGHGCALAGMGFHQPGSGGSGTTQSPSFVGISNNTLTSGYARDDANQIPFPVYFFNNSGTGNSASLITTNEGSTGGACGNTNPFTGALYSSNDFLVRDREYFTDLSSPSNFQGVQKGLLSARPTIGYPGVAYYATDTTTLYSIANASGKGYSFTPRGSVAQNPMIDDGGWVQGHTTGLAWGDVQTILTGNMVTGTVLSPTCGSVSTGCNDSTAIRSGVWTNDQQAEATVRSKNRNSSKFEEVELRLRTNISANSITGYEFNFAVDSDGSQYAQIVKWNGPLGSFTLLDSRGSPTVPALVNGAVIKATAIGNQLCTYENNVQLFCVTDSSFPSGAPGIGIFDQAGVSGDFNDFGLTNFKATSLGASSAVWLTVWTPYTYPHPMRGAPLPSINFSPNPVAFGNQLSGTTSSGLTVTVSNVGSADEILSTPFFTITGTNSTDFARTGGTCANGGTIIAGGSCTIISTFTPGAVGARSGTLNINGTVSASVSMTGTGTSPSSPVLGFAPNPVAFGNQLVSTTSTAITVTVSNSGSSSEILSTPFFTITGTNATDFARTGGTCVNAGTIAAGGSCTGIFTFTPAASGVRAGVLNINGTVNASVNLSGTGTVPQGSLAPTLLTFGPQLDLLPSPAQTIVLSNPGTATLTISSIIASGDFSVTTTCGATLNAGANCNISVTFTPLLAGQRLGILTVTDNASTSPQIAQLSGTGVGTLSGTGNITISGNILPPPPPPD